MKPNNQINTAAITGFTTRLLVSLFCFICVPGMAVKAQDSITGGPGFSGFAESAAAPGCGAVDPGPRTAPARAARGA